MKDPDNKVLRSVLPKNKATVTIIQRVGWTLNQCFSAGSHIDGKKRCPKLMIECAENEPSKAELRIAHSHNHNSAMSPVKRRSSATLGISKLAMTASEVAYSLLRNTRGIRNIIRSHRHSKLRKIQGSKTALGLLHAELAADEIGVLTL